jgi:hypothetical protein
MMIKLGLRRSCPLARPVTVKAAAMAAAEPRKFRRFILWPFILRSFSILCPLCAKGGQSGDDSFAEGIAYCGSVGGSLGANMISKPISNLLV